MTDKPHFSLDTRETIKECQYATDKAFWPELYELMEPAPSRLTYVSTLTRFDERGLSKTPPVPPKPSLPLKLAAVLAQYAIRLFECEYCQWPNFPPDSWRADLRTRIEQRVMDQIEIAERRANGSLSHHGTRDQIRVMIRKGLEKDALLGIEIPGAATLVAVSPSPLPVPSTAPPQVALLDANVKEKLIAERKAIFDAYFASFKTKVFVMDMVWSSGEHPREWTRWKRGKCKDGSKPDKAFRAILTSGKHPHEFRAERRPKIWGKKTP